MLEFRDAVPESGAAVAAGAPAGFDKAGMAAGG